jgi:hypothetical protein
MKRTGEHRLTQTLVVSPKVLVAGTYGMALAFRTGLL